MERKLRMGMVGGGKDAFIGAVTVLPPISMDASNSWPVHFHQSAEVA